MPAEAAVKESPKIGYSSQENLPATRYRQGGRTVFSMALSPEQIVNLIHRPNPEAHNPGNRAIRPKHAADFAAYYVARDNWVSPALLLRAPNIFGYEVTTESGDGSTFGVLSYPKRKQGDIQILDGQHRILGLHIALDRLNKAVEDARDHRARALRAEGKTSTLYRQADKEVSAAEKRRDRFYNERITVDIHITEDATAFRQMFFDIADNALGITASVRARFDSTKAVNRAVPDILEHELLAGRVDMEIDRLSRKSPNLLSARHVTEITRVIAVGFEGRVGKKVEATLVDAEIARKTKDFLTLLCNSFPQLEALRLGQTVPENLRSTTLLGSPLMLRILAGVYYELKTMHGFSDQMVQDYFSSLAPHMNGPAHANSIWMRHAPADTFDLDAYGPNGRRQDAAALMRALWEWAVDKAAFVYAAPEPAPEPEPTEDELPIDYSDLGDAVLAVQLQQQDEELGISKPVRKKR